MVAAKNNEVQRSIVLLHTCMIHRERRQAMLISCQRDNWAVSCVTPKLRLHGLFCICRHQVA